MKIGVKVGDVMTRSFVSVSPETSVSECSKIMIANKVGSLIVKTERKLDGIMTEGDMIKAIAGKKDLSKIKAKDVMSTKVVTISPGEDMYVALKKMRGRKIRWLPVVVKGKVIGMLTVKDIIRIEPSLFDIVSEFQPIREEEYKLKAVKERKKRMLEAGEESEEKEEGMCEECDAYGPVQNVDGKMLCEECAEEKSE
jgi:CBS domain-containing protein